MAVLFQFPSAGAPTVSFAFAAALTQMVHPQSRPLQFQLVAESGKAYVVQRSSAVEQFLEVRFMDLTEADAGSLAGFSTLQSFLSTTVSWGLSTFTATDQDGASYFVRYWAGFDTATEASGRSPRAGRWNLTLSLRKEI